MMSDVSHEFRQVIAVRLKLVAFSSPRSDSESDQAEDSVMRVELSPNILAAAKN